MYILLLRKEGKRCLLQNGPFFHPLTSAQSHPCVHYSFMRHLAFLYRHGRCMEKREGVLYKHVNFSSVKKKKKKKKQRRKIPSIKCVVVGVCEDDIYCQINKYSDLEKEAV